MTQNRGLAVVADPGVPATDGLAPPDGLTPLAVQEWDRLAPLLHLDEVKRDALYHYCEARALYEVAKAQVFALGAVVEGRNGTGANIVKNPAIQVMRDAGQEVRRWAIELGITPRSAGRKPVETASDKRTATRLLSG